MTQGPLQELKSESSLERVSKKTSSKFKKKKVTFMVTFFFVYYFKFGIPYSSYFT